MNITTSSSVHELAHKFANLLNSAVNELIPESKNLLCRFWTTEEMMRNTSAYYCETD